MMLAVLDTRFNALLVDHGPFCTAGAGRLLLLLTPYLSYIMR